MSVHCTQVALSSKSFPLWKLYHLFLPNKRQGVTWSFGRTNDSQNLLRLCNCVRLTNVLLLTMRTRTWWILIHNQNLWWCNFIPTKEQKTGEPKESIKSIPKQTLDYFISRKAFLIIYHPTHPRSLAMVCGSQLHKPLVHYMQCYCLFALYLLCYTLLQDLLLM